MRCAHGTSTEAETSDPATALHAQMAQGSEIIGASSFGSANAYRYGNGVSAYGSGFSTVNRRPTASVGATVIMYRADEPGAQDAFEAQAVLKQYSQ